LAEVEETRGALKAALLGALESVRSAEVKG
jgi:hypothetical protein